MKKTLVALAALAATSAFAQSSVTLSGNLDFAYGRQSGNAVNKAETVANTNIVSSTSVIKIEAVEDLGNGTKATVLYGIDPRAWADNNVKSSSSFNRDETYVGLAGALGNVRLGSPNSLGLGAFLATSPLGTGIGSGYGTGATKLINTRYDRSVRYDSPSISGLTLSALQAPGALTVEASNGVLGAAARKTTELGATYANGPLALAFVNVSQAADGTSVKSSSNVYGGQYTLGSTTLYGAYIDGEALAASTTTAAKVKVQRYAVKHAVTPTIDVMASYQDAKVVSNATHDKVTGVRADYKLSKTTAVYAGYEKVSDKTGLILTTANTNARNLASVGLRKSF